MNKEEHRNWTRQSVRSRKPGSREKHRVEISAGGLVYKRTSKGIFFAMQKDSFGKWTFPKGHVHVGETYKKAAIREIKEEIGLSSVRYMHSLGYIDIWFRDRFVFKGKLVRKFIHYYLFEAPPEAQIRLQKNLPQGEVIMDAQWVPLQKVWLRSDYHDMKPILRNALEILQKHERKPRFFPQRKVRRV